MSRRSESRHSFRRPVPVDRLSWQLGTVVGTRADGSEVRSSFGMDEREGMQLLDLSTSSFTDLVALRFDVEPRGYSYVAFSGGGYSEVTLWPLGPGEFYIDNVALQTVAAVPEPSTYALMVLPLALVLWMGRRRARQGSSDVIVRGFSRA
jgi:hypothetical protein